MHVTINEFSDVRRMGSRLTAQCETGDGLCA